MTEPTQNRINFCICTYNRVNYLEKCVRALLPQLIPEKTICTIVDNLSTDHTSDFVRALSVENNLVQDVHEEEQGLSFARNTGWRNSSFEWTFYLDDDCLPPHDLVREALKLIEDHKDFDAFGGPIDPVFEDIIPAWLPEGFGQFVMPFEELTELKTGFIRGGCFLIRRNILEALGGFNTELGVKGNELRYAEEFEFQLKMRKSGLKIGYAPSLHMKHFVRTEKLTLGWVLQSEYARRRDKIRIEPIPASRALGHLCKTSLGRFMWTPVYLFRFSTRKKYSLHHLLFEFMRPLAYRAGEWMGALQSTGKN